MIKPHPPTLNATIANDKELDERITLLEALDGLVGGDPEHSLYIFTEAVAETARKYEQENYPIPKDEGED